eukprot:3687813-Pleurochrysis_carterae.AAC.3
MKRGGTAGRRGERGRSRRDRTEAIGIGAAGAAGSGSGRAGLIAAVAVGDAVQATGRGVQAGADEHGQVRDDVAGSIVGMVTIGCLSCHGCSGRESGWTRGPQRVGTRSTNACDLVW